MSRINQTVKTPLGEGHVQGSFEIQDGAGGSIVRAYLVRLPVNDITAPIMKQSHCLTPFAKQTGLWVFRESELK